MKRTVLGASCVLLTVGAAWVIAQETLPLDGAAVDGAAVDGAAQPTGNRAAAEPTIKNQYSYALGLDMANTFRGTPLDMESLVAGFRDGTEGAKPKYDQATCGQAIQHLQMLMRNKAMAQQQAAGAENRRLGDAFLAKNKTQEGVKVTKSGLQYKVLKAGTGATPKANDMVSCNYRGTLIDGREFDASARHGRPIEFPVGVGGVIPGWDEALLLMKVGAKWQLFIPADLAYGDQQKGPMIAPGSTLVFDIELLGIEGK